MKSENSVLFWFHAKTEQNRTWDQCLWNEIRFFFCEMRQNQIFILQNKTESNSYFMRWDRIKFLFCEMKQNQILILWNEMRLDFFSWDETEQKMRAVLMKWNWIFMKQNVSFWFFDQSIYNHYQSLLFWSIRSKMRDSFVCMFK